MKEEIELTLNEANECLIDAKIMLESQRWKAAVSRSYYAMYHAVKAVLLSKNIKTFTHQGVNIQFGKYFVKTGIFDRNLIRTFSKMLDTRQKADYEIGFSASKNDALHAFSEAEIFFKEMSKYIREVK